jgi:hypothetical protein
MPITGPWYITVRAVHDYLRLTGRAVVDDGPLFDAAAKELSQIAITLAAKGPLVTEQDSGALVYREGRPRRWRYTVQPAPRTEGDAPQLVRVSR